MAYNSDYVANRWQALANAWTQQQELITLLLQEIIEAYSKPKRYYHNLSHIEHMLILSDEYAEYLADKAVVDFAIFYHDYIYHVPGSKNEHESAVFAAKRLSALSIPEETIQEAVLFIEATKTHDMVEVTNPNDLRYFLDFDMAILAASWDEYSNYFHNIRREYNYYPDILYRPGRKDFLKKTLAKAHIFHTDLFRRNMEEKARKNMNQELNNF